MSPSGRVMLAVDLLLLTSIAAGLVLRGRLRASPAFAAYVTVSLGLLAALAVWPEQLHTWGWWLGAQLAQGALRLAICVDIARRIFERLPRARARAAGLLAGGTLVVFVGVLRAAAAPTQHPVYEGVRLAAHVTYAGAWLMAAVLLLAHRHAVPVDRFHRELGAGLIVWSLARGCREELAALDPWLQLGRIGLERLVYTGVLMAWAIEAWRAEEACPDELLPVLRPWRERRAC